MASDNIISISRVVKNLSQYDGLYMKLNGSDDSVTILAKIPSGSFVFVGQMDLWSGKSLGGVWTREEVEALTREREAAILEEEQ